MAATASQARRHARAAHLARSASRASRPSGAPQPSPRRAADARRRAPMPDATSRRDARKSDAGTYLSMYFRDMAELDVLRPEEEFTSAREIEALEIMLWEAVLAHAPAVDARARRDRGGAGLTGTGRGASTLRRLAADRDPEGARARGDTRGAQAARRRRRSPVHRRRARRDRSHVARHRRARRAASARSAARTQVAEWLRRVQPANRAAGRRAQRLREGEPAPRRHRSRAASTTAAWRSPI